MEAGFGSVRCQAPEMTQAIPYVRDLSVVAGRVDRLSPLIRRVVAPNPSRFTFLGTGTYLVGNGDVAVIDPGPAIEAHVDAILAALAPDERITHLVITHTHTDHSPAAALLQRRIDAPTYGFGPHGPLAPDDPTDRVLFGDPDADGTNDKVSAAEIMREGADISFRPDVVVAHEDVIVGNEWSLEAVHTPGHTSNHLCFALGAERVLFTGDHVMGWSTSVISPPDGDLSRYLDSLRLLLDRDDQRYWPTHGPAVDEPSRLVAAYIAHRVERTEQIVSALANGPHTIAELVPVIYADVDKGLWQPAAASIYAHILQLVGDDVVTGDGQTRRTTRYRLV